MQPKTPLECLLHGSLGIEFVTEMAQSIDAFPGFYFVSEYLAVVVLGERGVAIDETLGTHAGLVDQLEDLLDDSVLIHRYQFQLNIEPM
jgi:hypothetical protein